MLVTRDGKPYKLLCPDCKGEDIGESGLGGGLAHCFGYCMRDLSKESCIEVLASPGEVHALSQGPN